MVRKRYTEEQIIGVLKKSEAGAKIGELCRKHGMSEGTLYLQVESQVRWVDCERTEEAEVP